MSIKFEVVNSSMLITSIELLSTVFVRCVSIADAVIKAQIQKTNIFHMLLRNLVCLSLPQSTNRQRHCGDFQIFSQFVTARFILQFQQKITEKRRKMSHFIIPSLARKQGKLMLATCSFDILFSLLLYGAPYG